MCLIMRIETDNRQGLHGTLYVFPAAAASGARLSPEWRPTHMPFSR